MMPERNVWGRCGAGVAAALVACASPGAREEAAQTTQAVTLSGEVYFPSPGATPVRGYTGSPVTVATIGDRRLIGFRHNPSGFAALPVDLAWNALSPPQGNPAAVSGVLAAQGSSVLGAWYSVAPAPGALGVGAFTPDGAPASTPLSLPAFRPEGFRPAASEPAIGWTASNALLVWPTPLGASQIVVRGVRVSAAGALLSPTEGVAISTPIVYSMPGAAPVGISIACLPASCLVAWTGNNGLSPWDTFVRRVGADATPLDAAPVRVGASLHNRLLPVVSTDGTNFLVVWHEVDTTSAAPGVYARRMSAAGAWLDAAPVLLRTLPTVMESEVATIRSAVAWRGGAWRVLTHGTSPWTYAALGADGRVVTAATELPRTTAVDRLAMVPTATGWEGVYAHPSQGHLLRFELSAAGALVRHEVPVVDPAGPDQFALGGVAYAGGRFVVGVTEGLWRVTPDALREGAAATAYPSDLTEPLAPGIVVGTFFAHLTASAERLMLTARAQSSGRMVSLQSAVGEATLAGFTPTTRRLSQADATAAAVSEGPGAGFVLGVAGSGGLDLARVSATGATTYSVRLPGWSYVPALGSSATRTLVARVRADGVGPSYACVRELLLVDGAGAVQGLQELSRSGPTTTACEPVGGAGAIASNGASFLFAVDNRAQVVTVDPAIALGPAATLPAGAAAAVWNGSAYVVLTRRAVDAASYELAAQRVSLAGALLDAAPVVVTRGATDRLPFLASDGAGRTAVLYTRRFGATHRAALRILDWTSGADAGVDAAGDGTAGGDVGADAPRDGVDAGVDADAPVAPPVDAAPGDAPDAARADAPDAAPAPDDVAPDAPAPPPVNAGCTCSTAAPAHGAASRGAALLALLWLAGSARRRRGAASRAS